MLRAGVLGAALVGLLFAGAAQADVCAVGDRAKVEWKGKWYPAKVLRVNPEGTRCYIHYDGYDSSWNEWVGPARIEVVGGTKPVDEGLGYRPGDRVMVEWKGGWYKASILRVKGNKAYIHYDGYASSWDEWVGPSRIRPR